MAMYLAAAFRLLFATRHAQGDEMNHEHGLGRDELRRALGAFATGVTVVTTRGPAGDHGMTANAFTSVSLDPALILVCVAERSAGRTAIAENGIFAVNVLSAGQEALSRRFARRDRPRGAATFTGVRWRPESTGAPVLAGAAAYLDCRLVITHQAGDHVIFVGSVARFGFDETAEPLVFHRGRYHALPGDPPAYQAAA
jgi:flavin reductase (DIM6/NTAB) family NADH-FMN oxidoreductase RutF